MRHVEPYRWADLDTGDLSPDESARMEAHAGGCDTCQRDRDRITGAREALRDIAQTPAPDIGWDHVRARVHWTVSSERRATARAGRSSRRWMVAVGGACAVAAAVAVAWTVSDRSRAREVDVAATGAHDAQPDPKLVPPQPSTAAVVTLVRGEATIDSAAIDVDVPVQAGAVVTTRAGQVALQLGGGTGFAMGPNTRVVMTALDERAIELSVTAGRIDVAVAPRAPGQRFTVRAGDRRVDVHGTAFRVEHAGNDFAVTCTEGVVVVRDSRRAAGEPVVVSAGHRLHVVGATIANALAVRPIDDDPLARSVRVPLLATPSWSGARGALAASSTLRVAAAPDEIVSVDGVPVGPGDVVVRVSPGRHHVQGRTPGRWVDVVAGREHAAQVAAKPVPASESAAPAAREPANPRSSRAQRRTQLERALDARSRRLHACVAPLAKRGLADGAYIELDIGINADGSQGWLNIVDTDLPVESSECVRDVVDQIELAGGARASIRKRIDF